jgi:integrase
MNFEEFMETVKEEVEKRFRRRENGKHEFYITTPKTASSIRKLEMTDEMEKLFQMQKAYQENMGIKSNIEIDGYKNFVFATKTGLPFTHESIVRSLKNIIKQANDWEKERAKAEKRKSIEIPVHTPHVWRHTLTTRLVEKEIPYERLKAILGHRSIRTTIDIYSHISEHLSKKVKTDLEGVMNIL